MNIGLLGGTFDPVHNGHIQLAEEAYRQLSLEKVLFIPAYIPPHKDACQIISAEHRVNMLEIALNPYSFCEISRIELDTKKKVYTIDTLRAVKTLFHNETKLFFLVGSDFIHAYHTWKEPEALLRLATFTIGRRPEFSCEHIPEKMQLLKGEFPLISSTDIREMYRQGKECSRFLPAGVDEYITKEQVYATSS